MENFYDFLKKPYLYLIITLLGISLKAYKFNDHLFWLDEVYTIQQTAGYDLDEVVKIIPHDTILSAGFYNGLFHLNSQNIKSKNQLIDLYTGYDVSLTPLHYNILIFWSKFIGDNQIHYRLFSFLMFLLCIPVLFLLAQKLFNSDLSAWVSISLFSFMPLIHFLSQQARYYTLWLFLVFLLCYIFLIAIDKNKWWWWLYALTGVLSMYACIMSMFILLGHYLFLLFLYKKQWFNKQFVFVVIAALYAPYAYQLFLCRNTIFVSLGWHKMFNIQGMLDILMVQLDRLSQAFIFLKDALVLRPVLSGQVKLIDLNLILLVLFVLYLIGYAIYFLYKQKQNKQLAYLLSIFIPYFIFYFVSDVVRHAGSSVIWKYHLLNYISILLFIAYMFAEKIRSKDSMYFIFYLFLLLMSVLSNLQISNNRYLMTDFTYQDAQFVMQISDSDNVLIISDLDEKFGLLKLYVAINESSNNNISILKCNEWSSVQSNLISSGTYSIIVVAFSSVEFESILKEYYPSRLIKQPNCIGWQLDVSAQNLEKTPLN